MASTFAKGQSSVLRRGEKEKLLFIAAAGLAFSLLIIMLVILNYKRDAIASQGIQESKLSQSTTPVALGTVTLFVPDREVAAGSSLSSINFKEVYWPRNQVPTNAVLDLSEIKDRYAKINLPSGLPIQRQALTNVPGRAGLPVSPGNRAVTIEVDSASSIEGYATPGSVVDVVLTYMEESNLTSKVIVEGARVLSFGGDTTPGDQRRRGSSNEQQQPTRGTITLDVAMQDALKISTGRQLGRLSLMLRNEVDNKGLTQTTFSAQDLSGKDQSKKKETSACTRGTMRIGELSYIVNCDGSMVQVQE